MMADLELDGTLNLTGLLDLAPDGGTVRVGGREALVERQPHETTHSDAAPPVVLPPPPASPIDTGTSVWVLASMNKTVTAGRRPIVALGMVIQGYAPTWPGMVLTGNAPVTINQVPINVEGDQASIFPSGALVVLQHSGQGS